MAVWLTRLLAFQSQFIRKRRGRLTPRLHYGTRAGSNKEPDRETRRSVAAGAANCAFWRAAKCAAHINPMKMLHGQEATERHHEWLSAPLLALPDGEVFRLPQLIKFTAGMIQK